MSKSRRDLDLDRTMPNVELVRAIFIYYSIDRQTDRQTDRHTHTDRQTPDKHEYSIVAVEKPQL